MIKSSSLNLSGGMIREICLPTASSSVYPQSFLGGFVPTGNDVPKHFAVITSSDVETIAANTDFFSPASLLSLMSRVM